VILYLLNFLRWSWMTFLKCYRGKIKVVNVDGTYLNHLRCPDDIVLISSDIEELKTMLEQLNKAANDVELKMNLSK